MRLFVFLIFLFSFSLSRSISSTQEDLEKIHRAIIERGYVLDTKKFIYSDVIKSRIIEFDNLLKCSNLNDTCISQALERVPLTQLFSSRATIGELQLLNRLRCNQIEQTCFNSTGSNMIQFPLECNQINASCFPPPYVLPNSVEFSYIGVDTLVVNNPIQCLNPINPTCLPPPYVQPNETTYTTLTTTTLNVENLNLANHIQCIQINASCFPEPYIQPRNTSFDELVVTNLNLIGEINFSAPLPCSKIDLSCFPPPFELPSSVEFRHIDVNTIFLNETIQCRVPINSTCLPPPYVLPSSTSFNRLDVTDLRATTLNLTNQIQCAQINSTCFNLPTNATFNTLTTQRINNAQRITTGQLTSTTAAVGTLTLTNPLNCAMVSGGCVTPYTLPTEISVNAVNSIGEFLNIQAQGDLLLQGISTYRILTTLDSRNYRTLSIMFQGGEEPQMIHQTGGFTSIKRLEVGYYQIVYERLGLQDEAYVMATPGDKNVKLGVRMLFIPTATEVHLQFYRVDDTSDNYDPEFFNIEVRGY